MKKEYEERQRKKKEKEGSEKSKDEDTDAEKKKDDGKKADESKDKKVSHSLLQQGLNGKTLTESRSQIDEAKPEEEEEPRVFALHRFGIPASPPPSHDKHLDALCLLFYSLVCRTFFQKRLEKKRQAEMAKRNRERLQNPSFFPSVPKGNP